MLLFKKNKIRPIEVLAGSDIGKERRNNEDSVATLVVNEYVSNQRLTYAIAVVADGMGGLDLGEVASETAAKTFVKEVMQGMLSYSPKDSIDFNAILHESITVANKQVYKISENGTHRAGTTLVGAIIYEDKVYIANVGDSRAYLVNPGDRIKQITKDHTVAQEMADAKMITPEQARVHPRRNNLTKGIGLTEQVVPDIFIENVDKEILLLCSDGLYGMVDDEYIGELISGDLSKDIQKLLLAANDKGGHDNISVALARV